MQNFSHARFIDSGDLVIVIRIRIYSEIEIELSSSSCTRLEGYMTFQINYNEPRLKVVVENLRPLFCKVIGRAISQCLKTVSADTLTCGQEMFRTFDYTLYFVFS
jgi:hypothetical protein